MPYIDGKARYALMTGQRGAQTAGELNYALTAIVAAYVVDRGLSYQTCNDIVGALEGAKAEFQRRVVAPYEDSKIASNGDVYPSMLTVGAPVHSACGTDACCGECPPVRV